MASKEKIEELKCALSDDKHFLIKPISLTCGHSICQSCIPDGHIGEINCKICNLLSDFIQLKVSNETQQAIQSNIGDILQILEREISDRLNELKGIINHLFILTVSIFILIKLKLKIKMIF